ncbi:hypothetical protein BW450_19935 [Salmonella enterica]|nr:hypothetical protein [Salmonella enterica]
MKKFPINYSLIDVYSVRNDIVDRVVHLNNFIYDKKFSSFGPIGRGIAGGSFFKFFTTLKNNHGLYNTRFYIVGGMLKGSILSFVCINDSLFKIELKMYCSSLFLRVKNNETKIAMRLKKQYCNIVDFEVLCDV